MVDRISMLPDEILCHILSFLPTQQAAATSVLSKRWKPLWTSVPVLDYDDQTYLEYGKPSSNFERFVYATILGRDVHQPIRKFHLKYGVFTSGLPYDDVRHARSNTDVNVWVNNAIQRGVENLNTEMCPINYKIWLSSCIFTCRTLVVLKLKGLSLNASSSVDLPSLKTLGLTLVKFKKPQYFMELLYGCPMLEDLKAQWIGYAVDAYYCKDEGRILPKLVRAHLRYVGQVDSNTLLKAICNVEVLTITQFQVVDKVPEFPHLRRLTLCLDIQSWNWGHLMLKNCPVLQNFKLYFCGSSKAEDVLPYPHLAVPECLTSCFTNCYLKYNPGTESDLQFAKYILQNSTSLLSMKVHCVSSSPLEKLEMLKELALCSRKSASCELSFV